MKKSNPRPRPFRGGKDKPRRGSLPLAKRPMYPGCSISSHIKPDTRDDKYLHSSARRLREMNASLDELMAPDVIKEGWDYPATERTQPLEKNND